jgi:hypothetical protein
MRRRLVHRRATRVVAVAILLVLALAATGIHPPQSGADGDPASDVLLAQDAFYPYQPKVSPRVEAALEQALRATASATGVHWKVAIIGAPEELGVVPEFFGHPQAYANFLDREISFNTPQSLLVVMPGGFGAVPARVTGALTHATVDTKHGSDGLTRSAMLAVVAIARSQGHAIATPSISTSSSGSSPPAVLVFGLPAALLIVAGLAVIRKGRSRR